MHKRERSCKKFINYQPPKEPPKEPKEPKELKELKQVPVEAAPRSVPFEELQFSPPEVFIVPQKETLNLLELKSEVDRLNSVMVEYMKKTEERFEKLAVLLSRSG